MKLVNITLCLWFRASLICINNCPARCNTKQSIYYSASSLYMFRVSTTSIIRSNLATLEGGVPEAVVTVLCTPRFAGWSLQNEPHQISNTQRTENKTTDVVIQQHSRKILMMDILMSETCWARKKWNEIASDIKLVFHSSAMNLSFEIFLLFLEHPSFTQNFWRRRDSFIQTFWQHNFRCKLLKPPYVRLKTILTCIFGGLGVAYWPSVPKFAGSNPAEAVGFLGRKNLQQTFLRKGSKAVGPTSQICGM